MNDYTLLVLHKLEHTFGYYDVRTGKRLATLNTLEYPHEICLDPGRSKIYIAEMGVRGIESEGEGGHTVAVFDLKAQERISTIDTGHYDRPHGIATYGSYLYVTSESTKHLLVYDLKTEKLIDAVYLEQECAHMVGVSPDGTRIHTANIQSNSITAVDAVTLKVLQHIPVLERPEGMVYSTDGKWIYCVCREAKAAVIVDWDEGKMVDKIVTGNGPVRVVITPGGNRLVIPLFHSAAVEVVETSTRKVTHTIQVGPHPAGTCISPDGELVFISCEDENIVYVIHMDTMEIVQKIKTGNGADAMVCLFSRELQ